MTSRSYVWTSYDMSWTHPPVDGTKIRYSVWQKEKCPVTGRLHLQGYSELKDSVRIPAFQKMTGLIGAHCEKRKGTREEAREYCMKSATRIEGPFEVGEWKEGGQGKRTDLDEVAKMVKDKKPIVEIADTFPTQFIKFHRGIEKLHFTLNRPVKMKPNVYWIHGPSGVGKTKLAYERSPNAYWKMNGNKWWDGYDGSSDVIIDDFKGDLEFAYLLRILDRYPINVEVKGGTIHFNPQNIYITSLEGPLHYIPYTEDKTQLLRRIDEIIDLTPKLS